MRFRPCIDLHDGKVKQIVGSTLADGKEPETNFQAEKPARWYAELYRQDNLPGGHIIQLGPGNTEAAKSALAAWPGGLQIGGGVGADNALAWLEAGARAVIVTSWVFHDGRIDGKRLEQLVTRVGRDRLVLDLSCRRKGADYYIVTDRWQTFTREKVSLDLLDTLSGAAHEFLIHAVDVEGKCLGIEKPLVDLLGGWGKIPVTYAGGIHSQKDILLIDEIGKGRLDFTVGSALDIFGGTQLAYREIAGKFSGGILAPPV